MKTLIAIPCMDTVPYEFAQALLWLKKGQDVTVLFRANSLVYDSRNLISLAAMENHFDRVMWFDSDIVFQPDTMERLHADMDRYHADMVTGLYVKRHTPVEPVIYSTVMEPATDSTGKPVNRVTPCTEYPKDDVFPVEGCGFGCVMTSVQILRDVWKRFGPAFAPLPWTGEDISFCWRARQLGASILCDSGVNCGHIGKMIYTDDMLKRGEET